MATTEKKNLETSEDPRPFREVLGELNDGELHTDLSADLQDLIRSVKETGRKGELTIVLKVKPSGNSLLVTADFKVKKPARERGESLFFATPDGNLTRTSPQKQLDLKRVDESPTPIKRVV